MLPPKARGSIELHCAPFRRRRHAHDAEERFQLDLQAPRHGADAAVGIDRDMGQAIEWEILGQGAGERPLCVPAPVGAELDVEDFDGQGVAALGAFDIDRAGQDVATEMRFQGP
jgi:hypothetical protein